MAGGATTVWVRPDVDSDADPHEWVAGGPHLLTPAERERLKDVTPRRGERDQADAA